jgi:predicted O-methyltransferase YrrM
MGFEHLAWLFTNDHRNRGICRLDFDEAALLYRMVTLTDGPILEIGRRFAGSTVLLAEASGGESGTRRLVSIDNNPAHDAYAERYLSKAGIRERVDLRIADSRVPLDPSERFGLIFIDGDHSYEGVLADTVAHWSSLDPMGDAPAIVVYHDALPNSGLDHDPTKLAHAPGVLRLCEELMSSGAAMKHAHAASMLAMEKRSELPEGFGALSAR